MSPGHGVSKMPEIKQAFELTQKPESELLIRKIGKRCQEFDVPDQMGQAKLLKFAGVFDVGGKKVADHRSLEGFAKDSLQDLRAPGGINRKKAKEPGAKGPYPVAVAVVFMSRLVNIETGLAGKGIIQFLIRLVQGFTCRADLIAEHGA